MECASIEISAFLWPSVTLDLGQGGLYWTRAAWIFGLGLIIVRYLSSPVFPTFQSPVLSFSAASRNVRMAAIVSVQAAVKGDFSVDQPRSLH